MTDIPTYAVNATSHRFTWEDGSCLELLEPTRDGQRRLWAEVLAYAAPDAMLNHKQFDLMNQLACDRFAAGAAAVDGAIAWGPRLLFAAHHVATTLDEQPIAQPPSLEPTIPWPVLDDAAYYGLAGDIVRTIEPHSESDPVGLLVQLLVLVGNAMNRTPYFPVEADRHYMNLFACLVGATSRARKGTSAGHPKRLLAGIDKDWGTRVTGGLSSGEGVIWHVRDAVQGQDKKGEDVCLDLGISDKRLCILESEFARGLAKTAQDGNILSAVLRQAWDHGDLRTLVSGRQKAPVNATGAHVSVIAHITMEELQRLLTDTEAANGFGNRFLWVCVRRSKLLPRGGTYPEQALRPYALRLKNALDAARRVGLMHRTPDAEDRWAAMYIAMAEGYPGLLGAITARAEAQVLRLSCLYALLDSTSAVAVPHLEAAYALWRYCEASVRHIFGTLLGDPLADDIYQMLQQMGSDGMTRTDINHALGRNHKSAALRGALTRLSKEGMARYTVIKTAGRPVEKWFVCDRRTDELNELSPPADDLNSFNSSLRTAHAENAVPCEHQQRRQEMGLTICIDCGEVLESVPAETPDGNAGHTDVPCLQCGQHFWLELPTGRKCAMCGMATRSDVGASHV